VVKHNQRYTKESAKMPEIVEEIDLDTLLITIEKVKRTAETMMRSAELNNDVKIRHKFCAALGISTAIYLDVVRERKPIYSVEMAVKILRNWPRLANIEPEPEQNKKPNFRQMAKIAAQGAGKI
jgi:hypothetical protein